MTTVFKCLIPSLANAIVLSLATSLPPASRLQVVALSIVAASSMLNPSFLGLPLNVQGVPFVQSIVIIHIGIAGFVLVYLFTMRLIDKRFELSIEQNSIEFWKLNNKLKNQAAAQYKQLVRQIAPPVKDFVPSASELQGLWGVDGLRRPADKQMPPMATAATNPPHSPPSAPGKAAPAAAKVESSTIADVTTTTPIEPSTEPDAADPLGDLPARPVGPIYLRRRGWSARAD